MADWRDVMNARAEAEKLAREVPESPLSTNDPGLMYAMLAVRAEIRALGILLDYARGDAR
jgi:hypothetical protein